MLHNCIMRTRGNEVCYRTRPVSASVVPRVLCSIECFICMLCCASVAQVCLDSLAPVLLILCIIIFLYMQFSIIITHSLFLRVVIFYIQFSHSNTVNIDAWCWLRYCKFRQKCNSIFCNVKKNWRVFLPKNTTCEV